MNLLLYIWPLGKTKLIHKIKEGMEGVTDQMLCSGRYGVRAELSGIDLVNQQMREIAGQV